MAFLLLQVNFFYPVLSIFFQYNRERGWKTNIELELKRDRDKMKIGQKQIEFFFQSKFKID